MAEGPGEIRGREPRQGPPTPAESEELTARAMAGDDVAAARIEVEQARAEMTQTADALQERLEPRNIEARARARAEAVARNLGNELREAARRNPGATAVAGIALGLVVVRLMRR